MKGITIIALIFIYAMSMFGISVKEFYCCGKLTSVTVSLSGSEKSKCSKEGCCKAKKQYFKVNDTHLPTAHIASLRNFHTDLFLTYNPIPTFLKAEQPAIINGSHAPPLFDSVPLYLSNCVFRI